MREGPQLGVAKAARAPPCTHPILGRRLLQNKMLRHPREGEDLMTFSIRNDVP